MNAANIIGLLILGACAMIGLLLIFACERDGLWSKAGRHLVFYVIDAVAAMVGFVLAFGLTVHSWFWLIAVLVVSRFTMHMLHHAWYAHDAKSDAEKAPS